MMRSRWTKGLAALGSVCGLMFAMAGAPAQATAILTVSDGTNSWTASGDGSSVISLTAADNSWVVFGGGVTKPSVGSAYAPDLHFGAFGLGIGDLKVSFSDDGFAGSGGSTDFLTEFGADLGGVVPGDSSLTLSSWSTAGGLAQLGPFFGPGAYSASEMDAQTLTGSYGLTLYADLTHSALAVSSFDASVKEVPEPGTLCLFGAGLLGAAFFVRRRRMPALASTRV